MTSAAAAMTVDLQTPAEGAFINPALLEVSNSCAPATKPASTTHLVFWGSGLTANTTYLMLDQPFNYLGPNGVSTTTDAAGTFTLGVDYAPQIDAQGYDLVRLFDPFGRQPAVRPIRTSRPGDAPCPTTTPPPSPCVSLQNDVVVSASGVLSYLGASVDTYPTDWYVDYPGAGQSPAPFASSAVSGSGVQATITASSLAPGTYSITARSRSPRLAALDVYETFPITVCAPPNSTTTTPPTTPTTPPPTPGTPRLSIDPSTGPGGSVATVTGTGFAPGATVVVAWTPGLGSAPAVADASGHFVVSLLVFAHDQMGPRLAFALGYPPAVSVGYLVGANPAGPPSADSLIFRQ